MPNIKDFKVGDKITLYPLTIVELPKIEANTLTVAMLPSGRRAWLHIADIDTHTPKPRELSIGDPVRDRLTQCRASITHIIKDKAWVTFEDNSDGIIPLTELEYAYDTST